MGKYNELTLEFKNIETLEKKFKALPLTAEFEVNNYMWNQAGDILKKEVYRNMPQSRRNKSNIQNAPKIHAKSTESLDKVTYNLGIKIQTHLNPKSKDFGYLIFPDEGRGKHQSRAQEFFGKALNNKSDEVSDGLADYLNKKIEEDLRNATN